MTLREWMKSNGVRASWLAGKADVPLSSITRFLREERGLNHKTAEKISAASMGAVTICELLFPEGILKGAKASKK